MKHCVRRRCPNLGNLQNSRWCRNRGMSRRRLTIDLKRMSVCCANVCLFGAGSPGTNTEEHNARHPCGIAQFYDLQSFVPLVDVLSQIARALKRAAFRHSSAKSKCQFQMQHPSLFFSSGCSDPLPKPFSTGKILQLACPAKRNYAQFSRDKDSRTRHAATTVNVNRWHKPRRSGGTGICANVVGVGVGAFHVVLVGMAFGVDNAKKHFKCLSHCIMMTAHHRVASAAGTKKNAGICWAIF